MTECAADFSCLLNAISASATPNATGVINAGNSLDLNVMPLNGMHCLAVADKYDVPFLTEACDSYLLGGTALEIATLPDWMATASRYRCDAFLKCCAAYAAQSLLLIISTQCAVLSLAPAESRTK